MLPFPRALIFSAAIAAAGCGRTHLYDDAADAGTDAGVPDAGVIDAGTFDAGVRPPLCPPSTPGTGHIWGTTPLGTIDFQNVWTGTESPGGHSCPHVTVYGSPGNEPGQGGAFIVDFSSLGATRGIARLTVGGKTATIDVAGNVTRADGLTMGSAPSDTWRTTVTFAAVDGGWTVQGTVTEAPDCFRATWFCI